MLCFQRLILSALPVISLLTACTAQIPSTLVATIMPTSTTTARSTFTPTAISILTPSPSPTVSIPTFASFQPVMSIGLAASEHVLNMVAESEDIIWLLTDQRVMQYRQGTWTDYLPQFSGAIIGMDSNHRAWVVSDDRTQVSVWDGSTWTTTGQEAGWEPPLLGDNMRVNWSLAEDAPGNVWLADGNDVRMFDGVKWKVFGPDDLGMTITKEEDVFSETTLVYLKTSGYMWALNCHWIGPGPFGGGGARWYDGRAWQGSDSPVADGCATVVNEDGSGNVWLGVDNNLWRFNPLLKDWKRYPALEPPEDGWFGFINDLPLDAAGDPWPELIRCGGASCYTGNVRYHFTGTEWFQVGDIGTDDSFLYFDANGQGWVFASYGVFRIIEDQLEPVTDLPVLKAAADPSGKLWVLGFYEGETVLWTQSPDG